MSHKEKCARDVNPWWAGESAVRLSDLPAHLPPLPTGRRVSIASIYRWSLHGVRGVRLRRFRCGGGAWATTLQELARWQATLTASAEVCA